MLPATAPRVAERKNCPPDDEVVRSPRNGGDQQHKVQLRGSPKLQMATNIE
jgi:hypothetical protein